MLWRIVTSAEVAGGWGEMTQIQDSESEGGWKEIHLWWQMAVLPFSVKEWGSFIKKE